MEKGDFYFNFHKPHPDHVMKQKTVKEAYEYLKNINML